MKIKLLLQVLLFLMAAAILSFSIYFYFYKNENLNDFSKNEEIKKIGKININKSLEKKNRNNKSSNILKKVIYENSDNEGNKYRIEAEIGEIMLKNSTKIYMTGVKAIINLENSNFITIYSDYAIFNNKNFETNFSKNIQLNYLDHLLTGENLDLLFNKNLITMNNQVVYKNLDTELNADRIIIDLITKNSKIFMNGNNKKIKIFNNK
tara:strand:+ start:113 stop:736 length:624 start_codon:yes stop_codon:yes gene_type:complete